MTFRVFVDGQEGTTGLRIHDILAGRSDLELLQIDPAARKDPAARARLLAQPNLTEQLQRFVLEKR